MPKHSEWQITAEQAEKAKSHAVEMVRLLDDIGHAWTSEQINLPPSLGISVLSTVTKIKSK